MVLTCEAKARKLLIIKLPEPCNVCVASPDRPELGRVYAPGSIWLSGFRRTLLTFLAASLPRRLDCH